MDDVLNDLIKKANDEKDNSSNNETTSDDSEQEQSIDSESSESTNEVLSEKKIDSDDDDRDSNGDDTPDVNTDASNSNDTKFKSINVNIDGKSVSLDTMDEVRDYFDNVKSKVKSKTKSELMLTQYEVSDAELALLVNAKKGDKNAIAQLAKLADIDLLDVDNEMSEEYKDELEVYQPTEVDTIAERILKDEPLAKRFKETIESVPERHQDFVAEIGNDPKKLEVFSAHIKSGFADEVLPLAIKQATLKGGNLMEHYTKIGEEILKSKKRNNKASDDSRKSASKKQETGDNDSTKTLSADDIFEMSDEDFANGDWKK